MKFKSFFFIIALSFVSVIGQNKYPVLTEYVTDNAQIFSSIELDSLRQKLKIFESETTHQVVILTINSLDDDTIENYAYQTFNTTKIGQKEKDNGVLLLFSKDDREVRLEIGRGLEYILTDALSSRIIRNTMIPEFKNDKHFNGINQATNQIIEFIKDPNVAEQFMKKTEPKTPWFIFLFGVIFLSIFIIAGGSFFYMIFKEFIEVFRGFFSGQISVWYFLLVLISRFIPLLFITPFIILPIIFGILFFKPDFGDLIFDNIGDYIQPGLLFYFISVIFIAILIALYKIKYKESKPFKISWSKSNSTYIQKTFSSGGSSSSYSSSSGGSSFSGGGGSSGGGGASGSW